MESSGRALSSSPPEGPPLSPSVLCLSLPASPEQKRVQDSLKSWVPDHRLFRLALLVLAGKAQPPALPAAHQGMAFQWSLGLGPAEALKEESDHHVLARSTSGLYSGGSDPSQRGSFWSIRITFSLLINPSNSFAAGCTGLCRCLFILRSSQLMPHACFDFYRSIPGKLTSSLACLCP